MRNKKLAIIDHSFHQTSGATSFLIGLLEKHFHVKVYWDESWNGGPRTCLEEIVRGGYDTIVFFQELGYTEDELKIVAGKNIIVIPMFDHTFTRSFEFWEKFRHAKIVSFSKRFHKKLKRFGFHSRYFQYFPPPCDVPQPNGNQHRLSGLFWQRTGQITWNHIKILIENSRFEKIHIHLAVDPPGDPITRPPGEDNTNYRITTSQWFPDKENYLELLDAADVFFAPRLREGIGMSFLEAMAKGKCVVAADNATMNEYITHGKTGLLYNPANLKPLNFSKVKEIGCSAGKYIEQGNQLWLEVRKELIAFIHRPVVKPSLHKYLPRKITAAVKKKIKRDFPGLADLLIKAKKSAARDLNFSTNPAGLFADKE